MRAAGLSDAEIGQSARDYAANLKGTPQDPFSQATQKAMASPISSGFKAIYEDPSKLLNKENMRYGLAAAAPLLSQEPKRQTYQGGGSNPYQYEYDPGRTGAMPSASSSEQKFFDPRFKRMAEGGSTSDANPYSYVYDPITRTYKSASAAQAAPVDARTSQASARYYEGEPGPSAPDPNNNWSELTPEQQAGYYAQHPVMSGITQFGQGLFGLTTPGMIQNMLVPNFVQQQHLIAQGINPTGLATMSPQDQANINAQGSYAEGQVDTGPMGGNGADNEDAGLGAALAAAAANNNVDVGGPIASGDATGVDIGGIGDAIAGGISGADVGGIGDAVSADGGSGDGGGDGGGDGADYARGGLSAAFARGGYNLGDYSDGGRLLRGPGDGVSDSIPASIANKRPARLADGEFVIPARIVSELGNGSTEAGARKLYAMMNRVQKNRAKTVGKGKVAVNSRSEKLLPA
jgi:hypothetical protein